MPTEHVEHQAEAGPDRAARAGSACGHDPGGSAARSLLGLQRSAGNGAVAAAMGRVTVQRGLFDSLGGLFGGGGAGGMANQGAQAGMGALGGAVGGPFGGLLGGMGGGMGGVAQNLAGGNFGGALGGLQGVGAGAAGGLGGMGMGALGGAVGGPFGGLLSGMGGAVGGGLSSMVMGGSPEQAGMGVLGAGAPGIMSLISSLLGGL